MQPCLKGVAKLATRKWERIDGQTTDLPRSSSHQVSPRSPGGHDASKLGKLLGQDQSPLLAQAKVGKCPCWGTKVVRVLQLARRSPNSTAGGGYRPQEPWGSAENGIAWRIRLETNSVARRDSVPLCPRVPDDEYVWSDAVAGGKAKFSLQLPSGHLSRSVPTRIVGGRASPTVRPWLEG